MDLNELLYRHQVALIRAKNRQPVAPVAHYAGLLTELRTRLGVAPYAEAHS